MQVNLKPIGEILKSNYLEVPPFQRPYAWGGDNIRQLLEDVKGNLGKEEYFIGTIVTSVQERESAPLRVIDGQQRLATVSIMLAAVRDRMNEVDGSGESAAQLHPFLMERNLATKVRSPKLKMSDQDNSFFRSRFIDKGAEVPLKYESHKRLEEAYSLVYSAIAEMSESRLGEWGDFIESRLNVIHIKADREADAYAMFETINDRGVQLAQVDLIKTHLFKKSSAAQLDEVQRGWTTVIDKMEEAGKNEEELVLLFFRHYWSSIHGLTREKGRELYRAMRGEVRNSNAVYSLINDLVANADLYSAIVRPVPKFWHRYSGDNEAYNHVNTLESFGAERYRPLLLSALRKWDKKSGHNVYALLRFLVAWLARHLIVGELSSGTLEKAYCSHAVHIHTGGTKSFAKLRKEVQPLVTSDNKFQKQLQIASIAKAQLARYFLATLETVRRGQGHPELIVNHDPNHVHLEHILPKKPTNRDWPASDFSEEEKLEYLNRIGNLTLLSAPLNRAAQNGPFKAKRETYRESELHITKDIFRHYRKWNVQSVEKRQEELAALAVRAWSIRGE